MADGIKVINESLRKRAERRVSSMEARRKPLEPTYRELSNNFAPLRGRMNDEKPEALMGRHRQIYNPTPKLVVRTLSSGLHAGMSSPSRPWFRMVTPDRDMVEFGPIKNWLATVEATQRRIFAKSNTYTALPSMYGEWGTFGTMAGLVFEDDRDIIRIEWETTGQFWIAENRYGRVDTYHRRRQMTARQMLQEFGADSLPNNVRQAISAGRLDNPFKVYHLVTPSESGGTWDSLYWMMGDDRPDQFLAKRTFHSNPILSGRWDFVAGDVYGTECPGIMALPAARQLQKIEIQIANAEEKNENPPLQAPSSLANTGIYIAPGEINYVADTSQAGIRSIYDQKFDTTGSHESRMLRERELKETFYYDLFLMLTQDERNQRATAEEIRALYEEKVTGLAPVIEQGNPMLASLISRTFDIGVKRSEPYWRGVFDGEPLFPEPPKELQDIELEVEFISPLQQAQRAGDLGNMERFMSVVSGAASVNPAVLDKVDFDQYLDEFGSALYIPPRIVRDDDTVSAMRQERAQKENMQQMAQMAPALKQGADALSTLTQTNANPDSVLAGIAGGGLGDALGGGQ